MTKTVTTRLDDDHEVLMDTMISQGIGKDCADIMRKAFANYIEIAASVDPLVAEARQEIAQRNLDSHLQDLISKLGQGVVTGLSLSPETQQ